MQEDAGITETLEIFTGLTSSERSHHVYWGGDGGGPYEEAVRKHALELRSDDSIWCGEMPLVYAGSEDVRLLRFHLDGIAQAMPKAPWSARDPDGPQLPDGVLELRIDATAPHHLLQRTLEACGRREAQIWKFDMVQVRHGKPDTHMPFALPKDVGVAVEEGEVPTDPPLEIRLRSLDTGDSGPRLVEYLARYTTAVATDAAGGFAPVLESRTTGDLGTLRSFLHEAHAARPHIAVTIDARAGILYGEVVAVLDLAIEAGFTDITFVGEYKR